jgi:hypothetical protein
MIRKIVLAAPLLLLSAPALASCSIHNDTKWDFKVESGNVSNQSVEAHSQTTINAGKIKGKDEKEGKTISGSCKDGDSLEITDEDGIPVLEVK